MDGRGCPFCHSNSSRIVGVRADVWLRCQNCRSAFRDITSRRFQQIHDESFLDTALIESTVAFTGQRPLRELWGELAGPRKSVLQLGPGSGHLLAAARRAGCAVAAVEPSKLHRDFIREVWNIDSVYASLDAVPPGRDYDTIVASDAFRLVYDVSHLLVMLRRLLTPGGTCYLSAPNARSLEATLLGPWWGTCNDKHQVSIPSAAGLATATRQTGLRVRRIWSTGLPLEFPVSALIVARDRVQARRGPTGGGDSGRGPTEPVLVHAGGKAAWSNFLDLASLVDPSHRVLGSIGRAGSLNAYLTRGPV